MPQLHSNTHFASIPYLFIDYFPTRQQYDILRLLFQQYGGNKCNINATTDAAAVAGNDENVVSGAVVPDANNCPISGPIPTSGPIFLLSHAHTDHMENLLTSQYPHHGTIYCSKWTEIFLRDKIKACVAAASKQMPQKRPRKNQTIRSPLHQNLNIVPLNLNQSYHILLPNHPVPLEIRLLRAHHCIGSVMFLLRHPCLGEVKQAEQADIDFPSEMTHPSPHTVLYTGDFRFESKHSMCHEFQHFQNYSIDTLIVDSTFCDANVFYKFPTREQSMSQLISFLKQPEHSKKKVYIELSILGTEPIILQLAYHLREKIYIDKRNLTPRRYQEIKRIKFLHFALTNSKQESRIVLMDRQRFNKKVEQEKENQSSEESTCPSETLFVRCTTMWTKQLYENLGGMSGSAQEIGGSQLRLVNGIWYCLYSIHSSYSEIVQFVRHTRPKIIRELCTSASVSRSSSVAQSLLNEIDSKKRKRGDTWRSDMFGDQQDASPEAIFDYSFIDVENSVEGYRSMLKESRPVHQQVGIPTRDSCVDKSVDVVIAGATPVADDVDSGSQQHKKRCVMSPGASDASKMAKEDNPSLSSCSLHIASNSCSSVLGDDMEELLADLE